MKAATNWIWHMPRFHRYYTWVLAVTVAVVVGFFENDHPPRPLFSSLARGAQIVCWAGVAIVVVLLVVFWFSFLKAKASVTYRGIVVDGSKTTMGQLLLFLTIITWMGTYITLSLGDYAAAQTDYRCAVAVTQTDPSGPAPSDAPNLAANEQARIQFGPWRGLGHAQIELLAASGNRAPAMAADDFVITALVGDDYVLPARLSVGVTQLADRVLVDVCVDLSGLHRFPSGTYHAKLLYQGAQATIAPAALEVTLQARYLWALLPALWILPVLAMWLVFDRWPAGLRRQITSFIAVAGPPGALFSAQGLSKPGWGGGLVAVVGLLAAMYAAAVGAAELVKHGGHEIAPTAVAESPRDEIAGPGLGESPRDETRPVDGRGTPTPAPTPAPSRRRGASRSQ